MHYSIFNYNTLLSERSVDAPNPWWLIPYVLNNLHQALKLWKSNLGDIFWFSYSLGCCSVTWIKIKLNPDLQLMPLCYVIPSYILRSLNLYLIYVTFYILCLYLADNENKKTKLNLTLILGYKTQQLLVMFSKVQDSGKLLVVFPKVQDSVQYSESGLPEQWQLWRINRSLDAMVKY